MVIFVTIKLAYFTSKKEKGVVFLKKCAKFGALFVLMLSLLLVPAALAANEIRVTIDGAFIQFDVPPQAINNRTMVPLRAIFESLGASVEWDGNTQTVYAYKDDITVISTLGQRTMYVNGEAREMDVAPIAINGRILVPARFVAEAFDCTVTWSGADKIVVIETNFSSADNDLEEPNSTETESDDDSQNYDGLPDEIIREQEE